MLHTIVSMETPCSLLQIISGLIVVEKKIDLLLRLAVFIKLVPIAE